MKLKLNKKKLKNLSKDNKALPEVLTPQVGGGRIELDTVSHTCWEVCNDTDPNFCPAPPPPYDC